MVLAIILSALVILAFAFSILMTELFLHPKTMNSDQCREKLLSCGCIDPLVLLSEHESESFSFRSPFGYDLHGVVVRAAAGKRSPRAVIIAHGFTAEHTLMLSYGKLYLDLGFDIVLYDHRYHGGSSRDKNAYCTLGALESEDLVAIVPFVRTLLAPGCILGLQGESMGSATIMLAAPRIENLSFVSEDCGFTSMDAVIKSALTFIHIPVFPFYYIARLYMRLFYKLDPKKVRPVDAVSSISCPMLFCHGEKDTFVPTCMVYELFDSKRNEKNIHVYPNSTHAQSVLDHFEDYGKVLETFLRSYNML